MLANLFLCAVMDRDRVEDQKKWGTWVYYKYLKPTIKGVLVGFIS